MEHPSPTNITTSTISLFLPFRYKYRSQVGLICLAHNLWLLPGKISPVNTVEIKRRNTVEIKTGN